MAGNTAILAVKIIGDSKDAQKALADLDRSLAATDNATTTAGRNLTGVWTAVAGAALGAVRAASDLEQAMGAVNQVFGEGSDEIMAWAEGMAELGLSSAQAAQAAAILGAQLQNLGIPMEYVATLTTGLIELGADLAAVFGGTVPQAVAALGAAMRGEFDTLERYGITLTADAVAAEATRLASEGLTFASEQQAKAVATLSLIWQQSTAVQGAAEEEADSLASSMAQLRASVTNLAAEVGGYLTPILSTLIGTLADVVTRLSDAIANSEVLQAAFSLLAEVGEALTRVLEALQPVLDAIARALDAVGDALATVIGWVESAIDAFQRFTSTVHEAIDALTFWNDTYQASPPPTTMAAGVGVMTRGGVTRAPAPVNLTINTGVGDPHAIAREIRKVLRRDEQRLGRLA